MVPGWWLSFGVSFVTWVRFQNWTFLPIRTKLNYNWFGYQINSGNADLILENKQWFIFYGKPVEQRLEGTSYRIHSSR